MLRSLSLFLLLVVLTMALAPQAQAQSAQRRGPGRVTISDVLGGLTVAASESLVEDRLLRDMGARAAGPEMADILISLAENSALVSQLTSNMHDLYYLAYRGRYCLAGEENAYVAKRIETLHQGLSRIMNESAALRMRLDGMPTPPEVTRLVSVQAKRFEDLAAFVIASPSPNKLP